MSSKKKRRREKWLKREEKRNKEKELREMERVAMRKGDIEEVAKALGIKLK